MLVNVTLRFLTPCLGRIRDAICDKMHRDVDGKVIFLQTWWLSCLTYAAKALNKHHKTVTFIQVSPLVSGETKIFKRYYSADKYTSHEAFLNGDTIDVSFCLPPGLSIPDFLELLDVGGRYVGISPYGHREDYGRFTVVNRTTQPPASRDDHEIRQPDSAEPRVQEPPP